VGIIELSRDFQRVGTEDENISDVSDGGWCHECWAYPLMDGLAEGLRER
jgi:hypothetical protein